MHVVNICCYIESTLIHCSTFICVMFPVSSITVIFKSINITCHVSCEKNEFLNTFRPGHNYIKISNIINVYVYNIIYNV